MLLALVAWVLDLGGRLGVVYYTEQYLALAAGLAIGIALLLPPAAPRGRLGLLANALLAGLVLAAFLLVASRYPSFERELATAPPHAVAVGAVMIAGVLEAVRRRTGIFLPLLLLLLALVALVVGPELPPALATRPVSPERLIVYLALDTNALLSRLLQVAAVTIAPFILFGALLNQCGAGLALTNRLMQLVRWLTRGRRQGVGAGLGGVRARLGQRRRQRDHGGRAIDPDDAPRRLRPARGGGGRGGVVHRRPAHATLDGRLGLPHGRVSRAALSRRGAGRPAAGLCSSTQRSFSRSISTHGVAAQASGWRWNQCRCSPCRRHPGAT